MNTEKKDEEPEEKLGEECKGIFLRCRVAEYTSPKRDSIHQNVSYRVLKKLSCNDPNCGQCTQFYEDLSSMPNCENIIWPDHPNDWTVYEAKFKLGTRYYDELYEDWEWLLEPAPAEKQV